MVNIKVLRDFLAVQEVKPPEHQKGLIEIVRLGDDRLNRGKVVAVGTGVLTQNGQAHKIEVNVGDVVVFDKMNARQVVHNGHTYLILNELSVLAVLLPEEV